MADTGSQQKWNVGDRVHVDGKGVEGTVAFIGETKFAAGIWLGVILDLPKGKNNGSVQGVEYFSCEPEHGTFVRENQISRPGERRGSTATSLTGSTTSLHSLAEPSGSATPSESGKPEKKLARPSTIGANARASLPSPGAKAPAKAAPSTGLKGPTAAIRPPAAAAASIPVVASKSESALKPVSGLPKPPAKDLKAPSTKLPAPSEKRSPEEPGSEPPSVVRGPLIFETPTKDAQQPDSGKPAVSSTERRDSFTVQPGPLPSSERRGSFTIEPAVQAPPETVAHTPLAGGDFMRVDSRDVAAESAKVKREYEAEISKLRTQIEQFQINKERMTELHRDQLQQLHAAQREIREAKEAAAQQEDVTELHETIEMLTLDKEMAEEKRDQLERELGDLKINYEEKVVELQILQHEVAEGGHGEASTNYRVVELEKQIEKFKDGMLQLRDLVDNEKREKQKFQKENKELGERNEDISTQIGKLKEEVQQKETLVGHLQEQVDALLGAEEMVERLSDQKLNLEDKIEDLQDTVNDYESMVAMNNEMIEISRQTERQLREQVDLAKGESAQLKLHIVKLRQTIEDSGTTLHKFRDLTRQLQEENASLRNQIQISPVATTPAVVPASLDFRLKIQDDKMNADRIDRKMLFIKGKMLERELTYVSLFLPDIYAAGREDSFVRLCIAPEVIELKIQLVAEELKQKFELPSGLIAHDIASVSPHRRDELAYATYFLFLLNILENMDRDVDYAIRTAPTSIFSLLSELEGLVDRPEKAIQYYVDQLKQSRLDETISVEYLESSTKDMDDIMVRLKAMETNQRSSMDKLKDVMEVFSGGAKAVSAMVFGLKSLLGESIPEFKWLSEFVEKGDEITDLVRKIKRPLDTDNELRAVMLPVLVRNQLGGLIEELQKSVALCFAWYQAVSLQSNLQAGEKVQLDVSRVKSILYSENDKGNFKGQGGFYKGSTVSPQQSMLNNLDELVKVLQQFLKEIDNGDWLRGAAKQPEMPKHPLKIRAEMVKKALADAEELRSKIAAKDEEILEVRKSLRAKIEEVSELQLRRSMTERKLESASKNEDEKHSKLHNHIAELTNKLQKVQNEYDTETTRLKITIEQLENDRKQMEKKLEQTSKIFFSPRKATGGSGVATNYQSDGQVDVLRQVNAALRAEIIMVKGDQVKRDMEILLPPLKVPARITRDPILERLNKLKRQKNALENERLTVIARTIVDLSKPKEERERLRRQRKAFEEDMRLKMRKIQTEIAELSTPGRFFLDSDAPSVEPV